jgi:hypothetical protein
MKPRKLAQRKGVFHPRAPFFFASVVIAFVFFGATASVVIIVVTRGSIVLAGAADPGIVVPDTVVADDVSIIDGVTMKEPDTSVEIVVGKMIVSKTTEAEIMDGGKVDAGIVVPGKVVV